MSVPPILMTKQPSHLFEMRARIITASLAFVSMTQAQGEGWEKQPPLPQPASGFVAGCVNGKIVVAGGTNWPGGVKRWLDSVAIFDPAKQAWRTGTKLPHPVAYAAFASDGSRLCFAGGGDGTRAHKEVYSLDEDLKLAHIADLPEPVMYTSGAIREGVLHVLGGIDDPEDWTHSHARHYGVTLADGKVTALAPLNELRNGVRLPALCMAAGKIFSFTGSWFDGAVQVRNLADAFACDENWTAIHSYPLAARGVAAVQLDDTHIYLSGGFGADEGFLSRAWIYEVRSNRYVPAAAQPITATTCLVKCGEHVYFLGGEDLQKHRTAACYRIRVSELLASIKPEP